MKRWHDNTGFSLAETLIALGILAIGMLLIAGAFPVAIRLTTLSSERTTAAIVAEEAFAKIKLYGSNTSQGPINYVNLQNLADFNDSSIFPAVSKIGEYEFTYPSDGFSTMQKQYCWSALCRLTRPYNPANPNQPVQVIVFVCRRAGPSLRFPPGLKHTSGQLSDWPVPVQLSVKQFAGNKIRVDPAEVTLKKQSYVGDGTIIVDGASGQIYRVVGRLPAPDDDKIQLDMTWPVNSGQAWLIPPPVTALGQSANGRNPCIAVYQKEIQF